MESPRIPIIVIEFKNLDERNAAYENMMNSIRSMHTNVLTYRVADDTLRAILAALSEASRNG